MKRTTLLCSVTIIFAFSTALILAHAPSEMTLSYTNESALLTIVVSHQVRSTDNHYIDRVLVSIDGVERIVHSLSSQETDNQSTFVYRLPDLTPGNIITVNARCNRVGNMTRTLSVD